MQIENKKILHTDILIIGGGTAGCYAALTIREQSDYSIVIAEKANIKRSGCLAAGVNAINAYIVDGRKPEDYSRIITGDLGYVGQTILFDLMRKKGLDIMNSHMDCGMAIFDQQTQDTHAGGRRCKDAEGPSRCGSVYWRAGRMFE